jgi:hypothetical protein
MKRAVTFLLKVILFGVGLLAVLGILALVQLLFHPFDSLIAAVNEKLAFVDGKLSNQAVAGISFGSLALVGVLALSPLLVRGVKARQYFSSFMRSTLAAAIYFFSDIFYRWVETYGRFYLVFSLLFMVILTFVLVEAVARMVRAEEESSVRTDLLAAIVSGLAFGIAVKLVAFGIAFLPKLAAP